METPTRVNVATYFDGAGFVAYSIIIASDNLELTEADLTEVLDQASDAFGLPVDQGHREFIKAEEFVTLIQYNEPDFLAEK